MELASVLEQNREAILDKWLETIIGTYPQQTSQFLANQKDRFRNPVGFAIERSIGPVYDQIATSMDTDKLLVALDGIIRIRSVQEFSPSQAVAFVFELKSIIRDALDDSCRQFEKTGEMAVLDERIDKVAMLAFDKYTECRQKLFDIRTEEIRRQSTKLLERYTAKPRAFQTTENPSMTSRDPRTQKGGGGK